MSSDNPVTGPRLELVVAVARNGVIGRGNGLPWRLPADLAYFKRLTMGHPVLMGRRTWDSIGRPLPGRQNLVLTRDPAWRASGAVAVHSLAAARAAAGAAPSIMVIGGAELYRATLELASVLHLTEIEADVEGDVEFPGWRRAGWRGEWRELARERHAADERHAWAFSFVTLARQAPAAAAAAR
jgi:dihydrofolate reductase